MTGTELIQYPQAQKALATLHERLEGARTTDDVQRIHKEAGFYQACARITKTRDLEIKAGEIRFSAEDRLGEMIAAQKETVGLQAGARGRAGPGRGKRGAKAEPRFDVPPTLADAKIDKKLSSRAQQLAQAPVEEKAAYIEAAKEKNKVPTIEGFLNFQKKKEHEAQIAQQKADIETGKIVDHPGPFDVLCIDPPWPYGTKYDAGGRRSANPYPEMSLGEITDLPVAEKAAPDAFLWLWTTHKFMRYSFALLDAWGFEEKAILTWVKDKMGTGHWLRSQSEFCILAVRGKPKVHLTNQTTVIHGPLREHSRKPDEFYALVEGLCIGDRRYDWFSREQRPGWVSGGNDTEKF